MEDIRSLVIQEHRIIKNKNAWTNMNGHKKLKNRNLFINHTQWKLVKENIGKL